MKPLHRPFPTPTTAADCYDWIGPEDVQRIALAALQAACRHYDRGEPVLGVPSQHLMHDSRRRFADDLAEIFEAKLLDEGFRRKAPGFTDWTAETIAWWSGDTLSTYPLAARLAIHRRASQNGND